MITRHRIFKKHYKSRILHHKSLIRRVQERLELFIDNPQNPILKDHQLTGNMKEYRSFSIAGDIRITYKMYGKDVELYDIGSHNQVY